MILSDETAFGAAFVERWSNSCRTERCKLCWNSCTEYVVINFSIFLSLRGIRFSPARNKWSFKLDMVTLNFSCSVRFSVFSSGVGNDTVLITQCCRHSDQPFARVCALALQKKSRTSCGLFQYIFNLPN